MHSEGFVIVNSKVEPFPSSLSTDRHPNSVLRRRISLLVILKLIPT
jgi:hypothetical protein